MTTFADLKTRIADELDRSDINTQIGNEIKRASTQYVSLTLNCFFNGTTQNATFGTASVLPTTTPFPNVDGIRGVMRTPVVTVPSGTLTTVRPQLNAEYMGNDVAVHRWGRVRLTILPSD